jgi:hypothetical protein
MNMNLISIFCIVVSLGFFAAGAGFFLLVRRSQAGRSREEKRSRSALADQGDRVLWEVSQGWSFVDENPRKDPLSRRSFFSRAAFGISAMLISSSMARGLTDAPSLQKLGDAQDSPESGLPRDGAFQEQHTDTHNDFEVHNDNMMSHQDTTFRNGNHYDVPHVDAISGHWDTHNDN